MIFITAKFQILPEYADEWPKIADEFTQATRSEPGCLWYDWSRSLDDPNEYVLVEAFRDGDAGAAHVQSQHFKNAQQSLPPHLARTPADHQLHDPPGRLVGARRAGGDRRQVSESATATGSDPLIARQSV